MLHRNHTGNRRINTSFSIVVLSILLIACKSSSNTDFDITKHNGHWVVINYWAEWCVPCIKEIPELNALDRKHSNIRVFGVNYDGITGEALMQLSKRMGITFTEIEHDPADALKLSRPAALPTTYLFNPNGTLSAKLVGPQTESGILSRIAQIQ